MKKIIWLLALISAMACGRAHASTCTTLAANPSQSAIQTAINSCGSGNTLQLSAGTTTLTSSLTLPCGVIVSGPQATLQSSGLYTNSTAELTTSTSGISAFTTSGGCAGPANTGVENLQINGMGPWFLDASNYTDILFLHNQITALPYNPSCNGCTSLTFNGNESNTDQNVTIEYNTFGDVNSCNPPTQEGSCAGITFNVVGFVINVTEEYNTFVHLNEATHWTNIGFCTGCTNAVAQNLLTEYNYFSQINRIPIENQISTQFAPTVISNNVIASNNYETGQTFGTIGISAACCQTGRNVSTPSDQNPSLIIQNNLIFQVAPAAPLGIETFGVNPMTSNNMVQGDYCIGATFAGNPAGNFLYNTFQSNSMFTGSPLPGCNGGAGFIKPESPDTPGEATTIGNIEAATPASVTSVAPTISPAAGAQSFPLTVTMTDLGYTASTTTNPLGNTGIWYTTDGSTPIPGASCTAPCGYLSTGGTFSLAAAATVKAVGMWGTPNQPTSYPAGYGFTPSAVVSATYSAGASYFLSPSGSDSNTGLSTSTAWLSPNHAVNCGDTITAASGTYSSSNFYNGKWGTVSCPAANNVAWLKCATFDTCKIAATTQQGMYVSSSYWGISGWEITDSWSFGNCYYIQPTGSTPVHHVIFANDIANGCAGGGFVAFASTSTPAVDYIAVIGDIAYGTGSSSSVCASGISLGFLPQLDSNSGTHLYVAGSFGWKNTNPASCAGTAATDGEGVIFDTFDEFGYNQQIAVENNIMVGNFGRGIEWNNNNATSHATFLSSHNTTYGNNTQAGQDFPQFLGEEYINGAYGVTSTGDLAMTSTGSVGSNAIYAFSAEGTNGTSTVSGDWLYSAAGNTTLITSSAGFSFGSNITGTNPAFASTTIPGAPSCAGTANVPACAATLIANFTPTATGASAYGHQTPSSTSVVDALYPQWLCTVSLPGGLVTPGCTAAAPIALESGSQTNTGSVNALTVGQAPVQQIAVGQYSDLSAHNLPFGGQTASWSSSNTAILNVTSAGLVSCVAPGSANSQVTAELQGTVFSPWGWTCNAETPAATPTFSPATETFSGSVSVTISDATSGATIYFTTDGSTPTTSSTVFSAPITITSTATVNAIATASGFSQSAVGTATYTNPGSFFISPTGSDSNPGTSASPWLTPNHSLACGNTVTASAGSYSNANFGPGEWGAVTCAAENNVAWLKCATFDACKIDVPPGSSNPGMYVDQPFWGVQGWEVTVSSTPANNGECFLAQPSSAHPVTVHHVIFANNVANGCYYGGFIANSYSSTASVDYFNVIGNIAFNAAQGSSECFSGISVFQPIASDAVAGTHIYVAGNVSYGNFNPSTCDGTAPTDGEGATFDTFDNSFNTGAPAYLQQSAMENNLFIGNGGNAVVIGNNNVGAGAPIFVEHNTTYGNEQSPTRDFCGGQGEIAINAAFNVTSTGNLAMTSGAEAPCGDDVYTFSMNAGNNTDVVSGNWLYSAAGNTTFLSGSGSFAYGSNTTGTSPGFAVTTIPAAPSCSGTANTVACMASAITEFTPSASGASAFGYQPPSSTPVSDLLFPQWLCGVTLPSGVVTSGCAAAPTLTGGFQGNTGSVNNLNAGASIQQEAFGEYSSGTSPLQFSTSTNMDPYGNTVTWTSSNTAVLGVSSAGVVTCIAPGTANSVATASLGTIVFSAWGWTCNAAAATAGQQISIYLLGP